MGNWFSLFAIDDYYEELAPALTMVFGEVQNLLGIGICAVLGLGMGFVIGGGGLRGFGARLLGRNREPQLQSTIPTQLAIRNRNRNRRRAQTRRRNRRIIQRRRQRTGSPTLRYGHGAGDCFNPVDEISPPPPMGTLYGAGDNPDDRNARYS